MAYESARYIQDTTIHMESGAGLFMTDIFTPGWSESRGHSHMIDPLQNERVSRW
ncbi:urease accessory protein UreD [[Brevibacterium] frigoritolerans]|uniref:Urease accessory protein UreD n=1 Tax=Peribacillus frigoritolerans TaxID=450367 RepID=A0A941FK39_9BACI|nr:urease accessory protein UreD [Peribacillus frigoritolerans]